MPLHLYPEYSSLIDSFNGGIAPHNADVKRCDMVRTQYSAQVDSYNSLVEEANSLVKKVGTTWYVIPVPRLLRGQRIFGGVMNACGPSREFM